MSDDFIDTNVFLYAFDASAPAKRQAAKRLLRDLKRRGRGVVSTQVLLEFSKGALLKLKLSPHDTTRLVRSILQAYRCVTLTPDHVIEAIGIVGSDQISVFDAQIIAAGRSSGCSTLQTEDLNDGQVIRGVRVRNPFKSPPGSALT